MNRLKEQSFSILVAICLSAFLLFSIFPLSFPWGYSFFERQRFAQILLLTILVGITCVYNGVRNSPFRIQRTPLYLALLLSLVGVVGALGSERPLHSLVYTVHICLLFILVFLLGRIVQANHFRSVFLALVVFHSSLICYSSLFLFFAVTNGDRIYPSAIYYGFDNIRFYNQVQIFVMPLLLFHTNNVRFGRLASILLFLNMLLMLIGGGLGVLLAWLFALFLTALFGGKKRALVGAAFTILAWVSALLLRLFVNEEGFSDGSLVVVSSGGRVELWSAAVKQLDWTHLVVGSGPGTFAGIAGMHVLSHPHNSVLELVLEWGVIATIVVMMAIVTLLFKCSRVLYKEKVPVLFKACFVSFAGALALSFVSGVSVMPVAQTLLVLFAGALLHYLGRFGMIDRQNGGENEVYLSSSLIALLGVGIVIFYAGAALYSFWLFDPIYLEGNGPRFWSDGRDIL